MKEGGGAVQFLLLFFSQSKILSTQHKCTNKMASAPDLLTAANAPCRRVHFQSLADMKIITTDLFDTQRRVTERREGVRKEETREKQKIQRERERMGKERTEAGNKENARKS